jgi:hypothetical protein
VIAEAVRQEGSVVNRVMDQKLHLHRSSLPLTSIDFDALAPNDLDPLTAEVMCGV